MNGTLRLIGTSGREDNPNQIKHLAQALNTADAVIIGAGAGLSTAAGLAYSGPRFMQWFADFEQAYDFHDMYAGGFFPFDTLEEQWAYWSRFIYCNRYGASVGTPYLALLELVRNRDYFVLTTNVDHQFQRAGFDKHRLFYTQGDYGLWQCSEPCHARTYDNEEPIYAMLESQGYARDSNGTYRMPAGATPRMKIARDLVPHCPVCGKPIAMNLRSDDTFVEDDGWHRAAERWADFQRRHTGMRTLYLELGVGYNTPAIIKFPFWKAVDKNPHATYACINLGEAVAPVALERQSILIDGAIAEVLSELMG